MASRLGSVISFTTNSKQKLEVVERLQELLDEFSQKLLDEPEKDFNSGAHWRASIQLEKTG